MNKLLLVLLCCFAVEGRAIVMTPDQPPTETPQDVKPTTAGKPSSSHSRVRKPTEKEQASPPATTSQPAEKPVSLPPPSKASLGFYQAAANANYDVMELYLQQGADINCLNCDHDNQLTALYRALVIYGAWNFQLADWLIQRGAGINIPATIGQVPGVTLVMSAADPGYMSFGRPNWSALDNLVKRGADVKAADSTGRTALHYIRDWNFIDSLSGDTGKQFVAFVDLLVENGIDVNRQDKSGTTALMNATNNCSPGALKLLISYGANTTLADKLGKTAMDIAMDRATQSGQNSSCNEVIKILSNPAQASRPSPSQAISAVQPTQQSAETQGVATPSAANFAGVYSGTFNGSDSGSFQVTVLQDGTAKLAGRSSKMGMSFTGEGKVSPDGSVAVGSASTGSTFTGSISSTETLSGTWKNTAYDQAGSFQGRKGAANTAVNPLQVINGGLQLLNIILKPR